MSAYAPKALSRPSAFERPGFATSAFSIPGSSQNGEARLPKRGSSHASSPHRAACTSDSDCLRIGNSPASHDCGAPAYARQSAKYSGFPLGVKIPNAETREALQQAHDAEDLTEYENLDALKVAHG